MPALEPQYLAILKQVLAARFVPFLPPLLGNVNPADHAAKQLSRAFSAFDMATEASVCVGTCAIESKRFWIGAPPTKYHRKGAKPSAASISR